MKRVIWVAVTVLIMIGIMGFGLHTLNNIEEVNQRRREKEKGEQLASQIAMTTATTSVWDMLRQTTAATVPAASETEETQQLQEVVSTQPEAEESVSPEVITEAPAQTSTVTTGIVINMN